MRNIGHHEKKNVIIICADETGEELLPFSLEVQPKFNSEFAIAFDYSLINKTIHSRKPLRLKTMKTVQLPSDLPKYHLTPVTLEYIKSDSPLIATLVSLVCSDELDNIEEHLSDDYFSEHYRKRASSDISLLDIRSYRYQKLTEDYPTLKRHLLNYVVPIANAEDPDIQKSGDPILKFMTSNITEKVKACMLNLHNSRQFQNVLEVILNELFLDRKWPEIIAILDSMPLKVLRCNSVLLTWYDFALCCEIHGLISEDQSRSSDNELANCLRCFKCPLVQTRTLLTVYHKLPIDSALELFELCCFYNIPSDLRQTIQEKIDVLKMYQDVSTLNVQASERLKVRQ